jgi:HSP20 family protein
MFAMTPWTARGRPLADLPVWLDRMFGEDEWFAKEAFVPVADVIETAGRFDVTLELPGLKPEDVQVEIEQGQLVIHGVKRDEKEEKGQTFHRVERRFGEFRRRLPLPGGVDEGQVLARYQDGVLRITLPKTATAQKKAIEIKT